MKNDRLFSYKIISEIATIGTRENMTKEVNYISWNGKPPAIDIRYWNADRTEMSSGITITDEEFTELLKGIKSWFREIRNEN